MADQVLSHFIQFIARQSRQLGACLCLPLSTLACVCLCIVCSVTQIRAQEGMKIWEFDPYRVEIWYAFSPNVNLSDFGKQQFLRQMQSELQRTYRATWRSDVQPLSNEWRSLVDRNFDDFALQDLTLGELTLVASLKNAETRTVRTMDAAIENLSSIAVDAATLQRLEANVAALDLPEESDTRKLLAKCQVDEGGLTSIIQRINDAEIPVAIIPKQEVTAVKESARTMITPLPWQTDSILRTRDKILFLMIDREEERYHFRVRELDCPMQYLGETFEAETRFWQHSSRVAADVIHRAFAPIARVEEAEALTAQLRLRAGGLIVDPENPARVGVGDIMQPIVRRDDRNGMPTLLQPLSFTYAAITATDEVNLQANVYTYSGGPGLTGRKNRRTRRILLRVRPKVEETAVRIVVRGNKDKPQAGCFIYSKDMLTGSFDLMGRTDWRGQFTVEVPEESGKFLPEAIRKARIIAKRDAKTAAMDEQAAIEAKAKAAEANGMTPEQNPATPAADALAKIEEYDPDTDEEALPLSVPLRLLYIKNGDTVVAKLPLVAGLTETELAELPDDSRRLEAEAFVRGFQGEILDLIGLRNLYAAQIQLYLKNGDKKKAEEVLEEMRSLEDYNQMAERMERLQREIMSEEKGPIYIGIRNKIDRMFGTTRTMLQKYLQDTLVEDSLKAVRDL